MTTILQHTYSIVLIQYMLCGYVVKIYFPKWVWVVFIQR